MNLLGALGVSVGRAVLSAALICITFAEASVGRAKAEAKKATGFSSDTISFSEQLNEKSWFSLKADGIILDLHQGRADTSTLYGFRMFESDNLERSTVTDTKVRVGLWGDQVLWTSRQAISSYVKPGTKFDNFATDGVGFEPGAISQRIDAGVFKTDVMKLSLFAEYARVGAQFGGPDYFIKRQDIFAKPDTTTTRFGGTIDRGPFAFTLEQRIQQSLSQNHAPVHVQNQIGVSLNFTELLGRTGGDLSWLIPSSAWANVSQGVMRRSLSESVTSDTTSDWSAGLSWAVGKVYANLGYWQSEYQSQLAPWRGSGFNGSLGFREGHWGVDLYFNASTSAQSYALPSMQQYNSQSFVLTSGLLFHTKF